MCVGGGGGGGGGKGGNGGYDEGLEEWWVDDVWGWNELIHHLFSKLASTIAK